jgi:hypothetical protein
MYFIQQIAPAALVAMLLAAGIGFLARWRSKDDGRKWLYSMALGLAYAAGHVRATGWPGFPPADSTNWLLYFGLVSAALSAIIAHWLPSTGVRIAIAIAASNSALHLLLKPKIQYGWSRGESAIWMSSLTVAASALWLGLGSIATRSARHPLAFPLILLIPAMGLSASLLLSGSLLLGQLGIILVAALLSAFVASARHPGLQVGTVPAFALLFPALLLSGYFFAELPASSALLLAATPFLGLVPGDLQKPRALALRAMLWLAPAILAVALAFRASPPFDY